MIYWALFLIYCVPHFRTVYYVQGVTESGEKARVILDKPTDLPEEERHYIRCCRCFFLLGRPYFPRYFAYKNH